MSLLFVLLAACCAASSNFFWRRGLDQGASPRGFLVMQFGVSALVNAVIASGALFSQAYLLQGAWSVELLGLIGGVVLFVMLYSTGQALSVGPAGITFAALNSATVLPGLLMGLVLGAAFGYPLTFLQLAGLALVVGGLFWSARGDRASSRWIAPAVTAFISHGVLIVMMQWQALLQRVDLPSHPLLFAQAPQSAGPIFGLILFLVATALQLSMFIARDRRALNQVELREGFLGGACNAGGFLFIQEAVRVSGPGEATLLFPLFAVGIIALTNLWSQILYNERVVWPATALSAAGIFVGRLG